jgi:hypothetical protein
MIKKFKNDEVEPEIEVFRVRSPERMAPLLFQTATRYL